MAPSLLPPPNAGADESEAFVPLLQVENLSKLYAVRRWLRRPRFAHALQGVSLHIERGETLGLIGETGCGKTTLARTILRLTPPTLGQIAFEGEPITDLTDAQLRPLRRRMQPIFQDPRSALNPRMKIRDIVAEGLRIHHLDEAKSETERVEQLLTQVGLPQDLADRMPVELSAGERQRVALARALAVRPDLLVCDEPVSALDASVQAQIINLLLDLQSEFGIAYLFISHDVRLVRFVSHRLAVMYLGRIVETGPTELLANHPRHPYTRALFNAVPEIEPSRRRLRILLEGEPPDAFDPPSGCNFHPRCPRAERGMCDGEPPALQETEPGSGHFFACYNPNI